ALHYAVRADDLETTRMLLRAGADVNAATREGITPLALAAVNGSLEATEILLEAGANAKATLPEGETVLMTAARTVRRGNRKDDASRERYRAEDGGTHRPT